jgi:hypothetical protein
MTINRHNYGLSMMIMLRSFFEHSNDSPACDDCMNLYKAVLTIRGVTYYEGSDLHHSNADVLLFANCYDVLLVI